MLIMFSFNDFAYIIISIIQTGRTPSYLMVTEHRAARTESRRAFNFVPRYDINNSAICSYILRLRLRTNRAATNPIFYINIFVGREDK